MWATDDMINFKGHLYEPLSIKWASDDIIITDGMLIILVIWTTNGMINFMGHWWYD